MARKSGATKSCTAADSAVRLDVANKFLEIAELAALETEVSASANVSASLAVLAGIAASDAACCTALGRRSRSQNHHDAERLIEQIDPGGPEAAKALRRLLSFKDTAHYGVKQIRGQELRALLRGAESVVEFARDVVRR